MKVLLVGVVPGVVIVWMTFLVPEKAGQEQYRSLN